MRRSICDLIQIASVTQIKKIRVGVRKYSFLWGLICTLFSGLLTQYSQSLFVPFQHLLRVQEPNSLYARPDTRTAMKSFQKESYRQALDLSANPFPLRWVSQHGLILSACHRHAVLFDPRQVKAKLSSKVSSVGTADKWSDDQFRCSGHIIKARRGTERGWE